MVVDIGCTVKIVVSPKPKMIPCNSPRSSSSSTSTAASMVGASTSAGHRRLPSPAGLDDPLVASPASILAYEQYLRLPELSSLWRSRAFPCWTWEPVLRPALQGLEITFRFLSVVLSDPRPYTNAAEWTRRLESLALHQVELVSALCADDESAAAAAPVVGLGSTPGVLFRGRSSSEVWAVPGGAAAVVSRGSEASLLPRLAAWRRSEAAASRIAFGIECCMAGSPFTLGVGEPNLAGKPTLEYDLLCSPAELHALKNPPFDANNAENQALFTAHQVFECWVAAAAELLRKIEERLENKSYRSSSDSCWLLERFWKLLSEIQELHTLMDPSDLLRLKNQLGIDSSEARSAGLAGLVRSCKELRQWVPAMLGVEADPSGGPRVVEAAMRLLEGRAAGEGAARVHLLQAFQAVEAAVKRFFFGYREVVAVAMGSLEAKRGRAAAAAVPVGGRPEKLPEIFGEPTYFPSLDAAKTFLGSRGSY